MSLVWIGFCITLIAVFLGRWYILSFLPSFLGIALMILGIISTSKPYQADIRAIRKRKRRLKE